MWDAKLVYLIPWFLSLDLPFDCLGADQVVLQCNAPTTPAVLVPVDDEAAFTYLVMPVQIRA